MSDFEGFGSISSPDDANDILFSYKDLKKHGTSIETYILKYFDFLKIFIVMFMLNFHKMPKIGRNRILGIFAFFGTFYL